MSRRRGDYFFDRRGNIKATLVAFECRNLHKFNSVLWCDPLNGWDWHNKWELCGYCDDRFEIFYRFRYPLVESERWCDVELHFFEPEIEAQGG